MTIQLWRECDCCKGTFPAIDTETLCLNCIAVVDIPTKRIVDSGYPAVIVDDTTDWCACGNSITTGLRDMKWCRACGKPR